MDLNRLCSVAIFLQITSFCPGLSFSYAFRFVVYFSLVFTYKARFSDVFGLKFIIFLALGSKLKNHIYLIKYCFKSEVESEVK